MQKTILLLKRAFGIQYVHRIFFWLFCVSLSGSYKNPLYWGTVEKKHIFRIDVRTLIFSSTGVLTPKNGFTALEIGTKNIWIIWLKSKLQLVPSCFTTNGVKLQKTLQNDDNYSK